MAIDRRPVQGDLSSRSWKRLSGALLLALGSASACLGPTPPATEATDAAREMNVASRFGRMDIALERTAPPARAAFSERRALWGSEIRLLDVEMRGLQMTENTEATIQLDYSWMRVDEGMLHVTRVAQTWKDTGGTWQMVREQILGGDRGLFGEKIERDRSPRPDVHLPTKTIREGQKPAH